MSNFDDWYKLPRAISGLQLFQLRETLCRENLFDTEEPPLESGAMPPAGAYAVRTSDGTYNDHAIGVWYDDDRQRWAIFNQDLAAMPDGSAFNVVVLEAK